MQSPRVRRACRATDHRIELGTSIFTGPLAPDPDQWLSRGWQRYGGRGQVSLSHSTFDPVFSRDISGILLEYSWGPVHPHPIPKPFHLVMSCSPIGAPRATG